MELARTIERSVKNFLGMSTEGMDGEDVAAETPASSQVASQSTVAPPVVAQPAGPTMAVNDLARRAGMVKFQQSNLPASDPALKFSWRQIGGAPAEVKNAVLRDIRGPVKGLQAPDPVQIMNQRCLIDPRAVESLIDERARNSRLSTAYDA